MRDGGNGETDSIDLADQLAPVCDPGNFSFLRDGSRCLRVLIANRNKVRMSFVGKCGVKSRVLSSEMSDSDDCGP